ncbi:MAG TPA: glycosyltransferase family 87 protein [Candidatus Sulfotelmatobacter sp.]|jgi:hypothetical protein
MFTPRRLILLLALLVALGDCFYYFQLLLPGAQRTAAANHMIGQFDFGGDFYPIWLTGRELIHNHANPYSQEMTRKIQIGLFGRTMDPARPSDPPVEFRAFSYPLYADLLAGPLLYLGFDWVRIILAIAIPVLTGLSVVIWVRAFAIRISATAMAIAILLLLVSYPALEGFYAQQAGLLCGVLLAFVALALIRNRLVLAGALLACASAKPQMVWPVVLWLAVWALTDWRRRKRFVFGLAASLLVLMAASELLLPGWFFGWWRALAGYSHYTLPPLTQLVLGKWLGAALEAALFLLTLAVIWRTRQEPAGSAAFTLAFSWMLAMAVLMEPTGGAVYDHIVLLPLILWLIARHADILGAPRYIRTVSLITGFALSWFWLLAAAVAVAALIAPSWARMPEVIVFPARMAAPLPFLLAMLLAYFVIRMLRENRYTGRQSLSAEAR